MIKRRTNHYEEREEDPVLYVDSVVIPAIKYKGGLCIPKFLSG
jgi:hypothetical protein